MMKTNLVWLAVLVMAAAAAPAAENLALGKSCAFSHEPNYRRGTEPGDATDLTDGKFVADGRMMWLQPGCVGWMYPDQSVAVTLDLGRVEPLAGFSWNCAGGCSGVTWPDFVNVYVSTDGKTWTFVGDLLARSFKRTGPPPADRYGVYRAFADDMSAVGRYVRFTVYNTWMRFVDEIEVFRGPDALLADPPTGFTTDDPLRHDGFLRSISPVITDMKRLTARADKVLPAAEAAAFALRRTANAAAADRRTSENRTTSAATGRSRRHHVASRTAESAANATDRSSARTKDERTKRMLPNRLSAAPTTSGSTITPRPSAKFGPYSRAMSPLFAAIAPPIAAPSTMTSAVRNTTDENARYATDAPSVFARKNPVRETGCASAIAIVPDSTSRRNARIVPKTAMTSPPVKTDDSPASRAIRVASPNWW